MSHRKRLPHSARQKVIVPRHDGAKIFPDRVRVIVYRFAKRTENNALFRQFFTVCGRYGDRVKIASTATSFPSRTGTPSCSKASSTSLLKRYSRPFAVRLPAGKRSYRRSFRMMAQSNSCSPDSSVYRSTPSASAVHPCPAGLYRH